MVYVNQGEYNEPAVVCSRNKTLPNPTYLWSMYHKLSGQVWRFTEIEDITIVNNKI